MTFAPYVAAVFCLFLAFQGISGKGVKFSANKRIEGKSGKVLGFVFLALSIGFCLLGVFFEDVLYKLA